MQKRDEEEEKEEEHRNIGEDADIRVGDSLKRG